MLFALPKMLCYFARMPVKQLNYVGRSVARVDGIEKVTGKAKFTGGRGLIFGSV